MSYFSELPWFLKEYIHERRWDEFKGIQTRSFEAFRENDDHIMITSATSSGKTEAALFPVIASLYNDPPKSIGALYIGPLKALINDQFERISPMIEKSEIQVTGWHGDISASIKKRLLNDPKGILQITPESLQNIIVNHNELLKELFGELRFVIIDEIHVFISSARGAQVLCCLETIERECGCRPRRIGLSATLGDTSSSMEWMRANTGKDVTVIDDGNRRDAQIMIEYNMFPSAMGEDPTARKRAVTRYYKGLFESVKGRNCLIFTNSKLSAEKTARSLNIIAEKNGIGNMVSIHHGSISKEFRMRTESEMKDVYRKTVTVATSSLELGIDVGDMERIIQIDPPPSCMSMLQRMGRSGRRGDPQDLTIICNDDMDRMWGNVSGISMNLIRSIAIAELSLEGWSEPLDDDPLPYGLLFHQTLEYMACRTGCRYSELKDNVLSMYPFRNIPEEEYKELLRYLNATEMIERMSDGTLLIGRKAEHMVFGHDFCSVFDVRPEVDIYIEGRLLGSIQESPEIGENIQLAGQMWKVISVSDSRADVVPSDEGTCPPWKSDALPVDDTIMRKMYEILSSDRVYGYLDDDAKDCLAHSRTAFMSSGMDHLLTVTDWGMRIAPWRGTKAFDTIRRAVVSKDIGRVYAQIPYHIDVYTKKPGEVESAVRNFSKKRNKNDLIEQDEDLCRGKFDRYLPRGLLLKGFIANRLDFSQ